MNALITPLLVSLDLTFRGESPPIKVRLPDGRHSPLTTTFRTAQLESGEWALSVEFSREDNVPEYIDYFEVKFPPFKLRDVSLEFKGTATLSTIPWDIDLSDLANATLAANSTVAVEKEVGHPTIFKLIITSPLLGGTGTMGTLLDEKQLSDISCEALQTAE